VSFFLFAWIAVIPASSSLTLDVIQHWRSVSEHWAVEKIVAGTLDWWVYWMCT